MVESAAKHDCCSLGPGLLSPQSAHRYAQLFKVLADPIRLQLLSHIADTGCDPLTVNELTERTGLSQSTVSHHLGKLTEAGLLEKKRQGRFVTHSVVTPTFRDLCSVLSLG
ncbi:helix-turn-helix transcriptional regulator [uncultured Corynebacterium sp.]|uniref:ArsR/SmtB family transcription factor n=1 Tax=uncultured Corynebacterium sp. TaxID=159447 RepID=UPI0025EA71A3|nr:metalloregulator ArsR/SmtB family transcription factor [uncultured Corynebacterium sp.]